MTPDPLEIPAFLRRPRDPAEAKAEWRKAWAGVRVTASPKICEPQAKVITDAGTLALLAEIKRREASEAAERARHNDESREIGMKKRTRTLAVKRAVAEINQQLPTDGDDDMAKKAKTKKAKRHPKLPATHPANRGRDVKPRFKASAAKKAEPLKKPRPERKPRRAPDSTSSHNIKLSEIDKTLPAKVKEANAAAQAAPKTPKAESKGAKLEAMLRKGPVSVAEIAEQLEWLPHTTRAAISRVGYEVTTEKKDGVTLYHIAADAKAKEKADAA